MSGPDPDLSQTSSPPAVPDGDYLLPSQLCIGLHVHLDLPWTDHPFTFSSFKIRNMEQVATLQALGLARIRYSPAKSDADPLDEPPSSDAPSAPPIAAPAADDPVYAAKRARIERLAAQRARIAACEKEFVDAARTIKSMNANLFSQPAKVREDAQALVRAIADSMLTDAEIAVNLMKDKVGGEETYFHALNVAVLAMMLGKELKAPPEAIRVLGLAAMLHDIGKAEIPDTVLRKTDPLTKPEVSLFQMHARKGVEIGQRMGLSKEVLAVIEQHHERVDGTGYPQGLSGNQIAMLARIVAVVNVYDNLCNPVNPARAMTPHEALSSMYGQQRAHFELMPLNTFIRCMGVYPPGTVVALSNGALALVVSVNSTRPLKPTVLIYDRAVPREQAILVDLESEPEVQIARALRPQQLPPDALEYLSPRTRVAYYFDASQPRQP